MAIDLRTNREKHTEARKRKVVDAYLKVANLNGSNWQKCTAVAKRLGYSAGYISRVINEYNESKAANEQSN